MIRRALSAIAWFCAGVLIRSELQRRREKPSPEAEQKLRRAMREHTETYDQTPEGTRP